MQSQITKEGGGVKRMCNYPVNIDFFFGCNFASENRIITLYFYSFLLKSKYMYTILIIHMYNTPIFDITIGQIYEGDWVKESAILLCKYRFFFFFEQ
jgi:hypothetical protein